LGQQSVVGESPVARRVIKNEQMLYVRKSHFQYVNKFVGVLDHVRGLPVPFAVLAIVEPY